MPLEREQIRAALLKKGFVEGGGDHDFYTLEIRGKRYPVSTKLSRGSKYKEFSDYLVSEIARQLGLTRKELIDFANCPLKKDEYVQKLLERNRIRIPN